MMGPCAQRDPTQRDLTLHGSSPLCTGVPHCVGVFHTVWGCSILCFIVPYFVRAGVPHFAQVFHTVQCFPVRSFLVGFLWTGSHCVRGPIMFGVPLCVTQL